MRNWAKFVRTVESIDKEKSQIKKSRNKQIIRENGERSVKPYLRGGKAKEQVQETRSGSELLLYGRQVCFVFKYLDDFL